MSSYSRRSSFSGNHQLPSPLSPTSGSHSLHGGGGSSSMRRGSSVHLAHPKPNLNTTFNPDNHSYSAMTPTSPIATSPSSTVRPSARRSSFGSSTTIQAPSRPIPISPSSSFHGSSYLAQRNANLQWAVRHNDQELMRTERAAIERYKQSEGRGLNLDEAISDGSVESFDKSFEIPIQDTSRPPMSTGVKYNTGRRLSSLAFYEGLPVPPSLGEPSSYSVNLNGGYLQSQPSSSMRPPSPSSSSGSRRLSQSSGGSGIRRPPSPYRASGLVAPLSPLTDPRSSPSSGGSRRRNPSPARPHIPSSASDPTGISIRRPPSPRTGIIRSASPSSRSSSSPGESNQPPTRIIHGFHLSSSSPARSPSPARPSPSSNHSISRGRAGSVSFVAGLGGGNHQQEMMEFQASRDFEVLDGERRRGRHSEGSEGGRHRKKDGKLAAAERLRKGYSSVGVSVGGGTGKC